MRETKKHGHFALILIHLERVIGSAVEPVNTFIHVLIVKKSALD